MKTIFIAGLVVFWSAVVVLSTAGLVSYENQKLVRSLQGVPQSASTTDSGASSDPLVVEQAAATAVQSGATAWTQVLVASHNSLANCWMTIDGKIYNVTEYVPFHPGGTETILDSCGTEATDAFRTRGGTDEDHSQSAYTLLANYYVADIGAPLPIKKSTPLPVVGTTPSPTKKPPVATPPATTKPTTATPPKAVPVTPTAPAVTSLTTATVATHNTTSNCWIIVNNTVYNITQYIPFHPGGTGTIQPWCGKEATNAFTTRGGNGKHSTGAWTQLENYRIGTLGSTASPAATNPVVPTPPVSRGDDDDD